MAQLADALGAVDFIADLQIAERARSPVAEEDRRIAIRAITTR